MNRLILSDLVTHARVWLGVLAVIVVAGFVGAIAAGLLETGFHHGGRVLDGLSSTSAAVIMFTSITALIVLTSTAGLTVALQKRSYALWQIVGIRPSLVGLVVLGQLAIVGALGAVIGSLIAIPVFEPLFIWVFRDWSNMQGISLHLGSVSVLIVVATVTAVVMLGGLRGARQASRVPPIEALRDPEPPRVRMGWLRILLTLLIVGGAIALAWALDGRASMAGFSGQAILMTPLIAAAMVTAGPVLFPVVLRAWTSLLPAHVSASWYLARNSSRYRLSQSTAAISPLLVAIALAGGLYTMAATMDQAMADRSGSTTSTGLAPEGVVILLGGPLLLSAVAAAATVFMSGGARERELALIQAAGSTQPTVILTAFCEAVIYTVTAAILGAAATVIGGIIIAAKLALNFPVISFSTLGLIASGGFVLILAATVAPTVAALRHEIPRTLAVE
jgi:putative ABC transport system permease protein